MPQKGIEGLGPGVLGGLTKPGFFFGQDRGARSQKKKKKKKPGKGGGGIKEFFVGGK